MRIRLLAVFAALFLFCASAAAAPQGLPDFVALAQKVNATVVNISTSQPPQQLAGALPGYPEGEGYDDLLERYLPEQVPPEGFYDSSSLGSGLIISAEGEILTNYHVVKDAREIIVKLADRRQLKAEVRGVDVASDLALLRIDAKDLPVAVIGDADELQVGEWVMAIGSPFGFDYSVTSGIVSAKGRSVGTERYVPYIQTDVAINPGNSGGPLFNLQGEVVGINSQIYSRTGGFMGVSFAIPINLAMDVVQQLRETGRVSRGWLGVDIQDVTRELAEGFGMSRPEGALVRAVLPDSPAAAAGIRVGDVILEFGERVIHAASELPPLVGGVRAGHEVSLKVMRDGRSTRLPVTLGEVPVEETPVLAAAEPEQNGLLGLDIRDLRFAEREALALPDGGVLIEDVRPGPGLDAGLQAGDIILSIDRRPVRNEKEFRSAVEDLPQDRHVAVLVQRAGSTMFLPLRVRR